MNTTFVVASREFASKRMVLYAGAAAALLALLSPLVPGASRAHPADVRAVVVLFLGSGLALGSALLVGGTLFSSDLADKRLAFYFSRPISPAALWWGKVVGGFSVVLLGSFLAFLPALFDGQLLRLTATGRTAAWLSGTVVLLLLFLIVLSNALAVAFRSRSAWLLLDLAAFALVGTTLWASARILSRAWAMEALAPLALFNGALLFMALILAGWRQVAVGRTDPKRAHGALSRTLWPIVSAAAFLTLGYVAWATAYGPADMKEKSIAISPAGRWLVASGVVSGRGVEFYGSVLVDTGTGRNVRLPGYGAWTVTVSRDGRRAAWAEQEGPAAGAPSTVMTLDAASRDGRPVPTKIIVGRAFDISGLTLSPDGSRIAVVRDGNLAVHDVVTGAIVASVRLDADVLRGAHPYFESSSTVTLADGVTRGAGKASLYRFDIGARRLEKTAEIEFPPSIGGGQLRTSPARDRLFLSSAAAGILLFDPADGRRIASLAPPADLSGPRHAVFLADGTIAVGRASEGEVTLQHLSRNGVPLRNVPVGKGMSFRLGGEVAPGRLAIDLSPSETFEMKGGFHRLVTVDLPTGAVVEIGRDLGLAAPNAAWFILSDAPALTPGSLGTRLFRSGDGKLLVLDPGSGGLTPFRFGGR